MFGFIVLITASEEVNCGLISHFEIQIKYLNKLFQLFTRQIIFCHARYFASQADQNRPTSPNRSVFGDEMGESRAVNQRRLYQKPAKGAENAAVVSG